MFVYPYIKMRGTANTELVWRLTRLTFGNTENTVTAQ